MEHAVTNFSITWHVTTKNFTMRKCRYLHFLILKFFVVSYPHYNFSHFANQHFSATLPSVLWRHNMGCVMCAKSNVQEWLPSSLLCVLHAHAKHTMVAIAIDELSTYGALGACGSWGTCPIPYCILTIIFLDTVSGRKTSLIIIWRKYLQLFNFFHVAMNIHTPFIMLFFFLAPPPPQPLPRFPTIPHWCSLLRQLIINFGKPNA